MARTKPLPPDTDRPPLDESRQRKDGPGERPHRLTQSGTAPSTAKPGKSSHFQAPASVTARPNESNDNKGSRASVVDPRVEDPGIHLRERGLHDSRQRVGDGDGYGGREFRAYYSDRYRYRSGTASSQDFSQYRRGYPSDSRAGRWEPFYHRDDYDDRSWRDSEWRARSSWGRGRDPPFRRGDDYFGRQRRDRYDPAPSSGYSAQDYSSHRQKRHKHVHNRGAGNPHGHDAGFNSSAGCIPNGRSPDHDSDPARERQPHFQPQESSPPLAAPREQPTSTEKLKRELEREKLVTRIAQERLERERIHQQLIQMQNENNDGIQPRNDPPSEAVRESMTRNSSEGIGQNSMDDVFLAKKKSSTAKNPTRIFSEASIQGPTARINTASIGPLWNGSIDDDAPATRKLWTKGKNTIQIGKAAADELGAKVSIASLGLLSIGDVSSDDGFLPTRKNPSDNTTTNRIAKATAYKPTTKGSTASIGHLSMDDDRSNDDVLPSRKSSAKEKATRLISKATADGTTARGGNSRSLHLSKDDDSSTDDYVLPTRKLSIKKKNTRRIAKTSSVLRKKKEFRCSTGARATLSTRTKHRLREVQKSKDEKMKHKLLKAYEQRLAALKSKNMHHYSEEDLMSSFRPEIIDHHLMAGGDGKFLIRWVPNRETGEGDASHNRCLSWISHEDLLFPALARSYLLGKINSKTCVNESNALKLWMEDLEEREQCLNCLNTFDAGEVEYKSHLEIDFCCFLCKCPWDHPLKHCIRNCEFGLKNHRGCCHQYYHVNAFESFVSPVGKVLEQLAGDGEKDGLSGEEGREVGAKGNCNAFSGISQISKSVTVVDGDCGKYLRCLRNCSSIRGSKRDAMVVCINAGVGSATVSLKQLGVKVAKIIHVEADRVARHVIRSNHDSVYGEIDADDKIEHIIGLYNSLADVAEDPRKLVEKFGPIDMIICTSPKAKSESARFANDFFELIMKVERLNADIHHLDRLFYLLESPPYIKDHLPLQDLSYCVIRERNLYICNWPILPQKSDLLLTTSNNEEAHGLPDGYALGSVTNLYASLRKALCVGFHDSKWADQIHPKFWEFLNMGPTGYDVKWNKGEFELEAFLLRLRNPDHVEPLSDEAYSNHIVGKSLSVRLLNALLKPMQKLFNENDYGSRYIMLPDFVGQTTHEHGGTTLPNSSSNVVCGTVLSTSFAVKTEVKEETDTEVDETDLFDQVEESIAWE